LTAMPFYFFGFQKKRPHVEGFLYFGVRAYWKIDFTTGALISAVLR